MKNLKPHKIHKLTKKELKKVYTHIWRINLDIAWQLDKYEWWMRIAENEIVHKDELLSDTQEALERRRILYDRLANHSTVQKPKSMNEMADALRKASISVVCETTWDEQPPFKDLPQEQQDIWMDRLLTILN